MRVYVRVCVCVCVCIDTGCHGDTTERRWCIIGSPPPAQVWQNYTPWSTWSLSAWWMSQGCGTKCLRELPNWWLLSLTRKKGRRKKWRIWKSSSKHPDASVVINLANPRQEFISAPSALPHWEGGFVKGVINDVHGATGDRTPDRQL